MRTIVLLLAIVLVLFIARYIWRSKGFTTKQISKKFILYGVAAALVILMLTGRVHWLYGAVGAALPVLGRLFPLIRYVPLLRNLYRRSQTSQGGPSSNNSGKTSSVQSNYLRMNLNHDTGEMDGEVLQGTFQGKRLSELPLEELVSLLSVFSDDPDSVALLQAYLDRVRSDWRESVHYSQAGQQQGNQQQAAINRLSEQEACDILGLQVGASKKDIVNAHRRLMQKLHPDRGGSDYLAAKINQAKELLLKKS